MHLNAAGLLPGTASMAQAKKPLEALLSTRYTTDVATQAITPPGPPTRQVSCGASRLGLDKRYSKETTSSN